MKCEQCGKEHDGTFGSGRFCCRSCSNKYVALHQSPEAKARKVAKGKSNLCPRPETLIEYNKTVGKSRDRSKRKKPLSLILVKGSTFSREHLKHRLVEEGYKSWVCERCGISTWMGSYLALHLHHKDGDNTNNELSNLEILCPNCHSQTENYGFKGIKKTINEV